LSPGRPEFAPPKRSARSIPPTARFTTIFPILTTADLGAALAFYRDLLGATVAYEFTGPDGEPGYVGLDLGDAHLGIGRDPDAVAAPNPRFSLWVYTDECDAAVEHLRAAGVEITEEPADQPWGERVARVRDPDGNLVILGQAAGAAPAG
jgi:lactoylglutathione lyase